MRKSTADPLRRCIPTESATPCWFQKVVEQSLAGIYVVQDGRFTYVNPKLAELFGYTVEELLRGKLVTDLVAPEDRAVVAENLRRRMAGEVETVRYTFRGLRKDGETLWIDAQGTRTEIAGRAAVVGVLLDVTDRVRLVREAQAAVAARDEVVAVVSHDLRNPLSALQMSAELLSEMLAGEENARAREMVARMRRLAQQMAILLQDLLDVSAMESGRLSVEPRPVRIGELLAAATEMLHPLAAGKGVVLELDRRGGSEVVEVDRERIVQVLSNLVGNAVKFTPAGGRITVACQAVGREVRVSVADTGPGIEPEHLPHLFDRFWKADGAGRDGAGLGLAIAKGIVEAHGGRIWAESEPGRGATLCFTLTRRRAAAPRTQTPTGAVPLRPSLPSLERVARRMQDLSRRLGGWSWIWWSSP